MATQSANSLDVAVASATASTIEATGLGAYVGFHLAIASSTAGAEGQLRYAFASAGRTDVLKVTPPFTTVPAVNDDLIVAKNHDNYDADYGNSWKLVLKAAAEWNAGSFFEVGNGADHMIFGLVDQAVSLDDYFQVFAGSYMQVGYLFGETSLGGWYFNNNDSNATLGYQMLRIESSATFAMMNSNLGTVDAHGAVFKVGSECYFYDASFTNLMYDGFRLKGNVYGQNLKLQGAGVTNDYCVLASSVATFDGPIILANSYGFQSSATTETIRVNKYISVNNSQDVEAHNSTTWEFVNPDWSNPEILWTQSTGQSTVSEIFTLVAETAQPDGTAHASSVFVLTEGATANRSRHVFAIADASGIVSEDVLTHHWPSATASTVYGPFTGRAWKYGYDPFEAAIALDQETELGMPMPTDSEVSTVTQASALLKSAAFAVSSATSDGLWYVQASVIVTAVVSTVASAGTAIPKFEGHIKETYISEDGKIQTYVMTRTSSTTETVPTGTLNWSVAGVAIGTTIPADSHRYEFEIDAKGEALADAYDKQMAKLADTSTTETWVSAARIRAGRVLDKAGDTFTTETFHEEGVFITNRGTGTIGYMTADDGATFTPPASYSFTLTGLKSDTEVRVYASADDSLLAGEESTGDQLVTDPEINDAGQWTLAANWSIAGGLLSATGANLTNALPDVSPSVVAGHTYRCRYKISGHTGGQVVLSVGGTNGTVRTGDGTFVEDITAAATTVPFFSPGSFTADIEYLYIQDLADGSFTYNYTYGGTDIGVYIVIFHLDWKEIRLTGITLSNSNQSIPVQQNIDRVYNNP